jgi:hypothetical protein
MRRVQRRADSLVAVGSLDRRRGGLGYRELALPVSHLRAAGMRISAGRFLDPLCIVDGGYRLGGRRRLRDKHAGAGADPVNR